MDNLSDVTGQTPEPQQTGKHRPNTRDRKFNIISFKIIFGKKSNSYLLDIMYYFYLLVMLQIQRKTHWVVSKIYIYII